MEEKKATANPNPSSKESSECEECKSNSWKYKCPACFVRTCSLPCVKSHKHRTGCTGKRSLSAIVPLSNFDDNLLLSDYTMLEDVKRVAESAKRMREKLCGYSQFRLPFPLQSLRGAASRRRTRILFLPIGMSKRKKNQTYYNKRENFISWTIEWRFNLTDIVLIDHGVHETTSLCSVIEKHLIPGPWNHPLRQFSEGSLDSLRLFIRKSPKGTKSPFCELDINASLREQLANKVILEYPVIYVYLPSQSVDFQVIKGSIPVRKKQKYLDCDSPSPKGVFFREEDVEDGGSSDPHVSDLLASKSPTKSKETDKFILTVGQGAKSSVYQHYKDDGSDMCDNTYSDLDLIHEDLGVNMNSDDTNSDLDWIHSLLKEKDLGLNMDYLNEVLLMDEELEEGELESNSSTVKEANKPVFTAGQGTGSFINGRLNVDDKDICDDTFSDLGFVHSSVEEKEACSYLIDEVLPVDEELEEGEIA